MNWIDLGLGLVVFCLVVIAYPIFDWLRLGLLESTGLKWLIASVSFVPSMLPEEFKAAARLLTAATML